MIPFLLCLISLSQKQINEQPIVLDGSSDVYASEFIFISTPFGIYTFDRNTEKWSRITHLSGLPDNTIDIIGLDEGILWVATSKGLASADVQINDWQTYELPGRIQGLAFYDEYVWVGGDFGLKRFDKYVETWEDIAHIKINHIFSEKDYLWCATDSGVLRYNRQFEKIEPAPGAPAYQYLYIIDTPGKLWFIAQHKLVAYEKVSEDWSTYTGLHISDYSNLGDSLVVLSEGAVYLYEPRADNWERFKDIEGLNNVNGIFTGGENVFFATDDGLTIYNLNERSKKLYNRSNGLVIDSLIDVYQESKFIMVISRYDIEYLNTETALWQVEKLEPVAAEREKIFYLDEAGAHARLVKDLDIKLVGRTYYTEFRTISDSLVTKTDFTNINLKLIGQHSSNRTFSLYYDDTDKEQKMYGFGYRGIDGDLLYRCNGGYLRTEYYEFDIIPQFSDSGANAKLRYKEHSVDFQGGYIKSRLRNDFFYGRSIEKACSLSDTTYQRNTFYYIYSTTHQVEKNYDTIFVDDSLSSTNTVDTRIEFTVAGITGDFDPLVNGNDYFIDYNTGVIHFLNQRKESDIIVLLINGQEIIIQSDSVSDHALKNIYYVGPDITPNSLSMIITDTLGQVYPLSTFGLDNNGDNQVDVEFINHDLGYLIFPQVKPFPDEVYDDTLHIYTMDIHFLSQSVFYFLTHHPILVGSEKIYVDGELMTRGSHYTIDNRSGTLLFLQEDIVSDFSEIEVQYSSVEREEQDPFYSIQPKISVGNSINIAPGLSLFDEEKIAHISGKMQAGSQEEKSIKFVPQVAVNSVREWAQAYSLIANYKILSINTEYRGFSKGFESFGTNEKKYGTLQHSGVVSASIEPITHTRIEGHFRREYQVDSLDNQHITQYAQGKFNYLNPQLPNGYILLSRDYLPDYEKRRIQINANYNLQLLKSKIKFNSVVRTIDIEADANTSTRVLEYILNASFSLPFRVRGDINVSHNNLYTNRVREKDEEEIRGTLNVDLIPGLYYTGNYRLQAATYYLDLSQELDLRHYFYNNLNVAPGRWFSHLSIFNFSFGVGDNFEEYIRELPAQYTRPSVILNPLEDGSLSSINNLNNYYATLQLTPLSNILVWGKRTLSKSGIAYYTNPDLQSTVRDEIRIEFEPRNLGFFTASWEQRISQGYPLQTTQDVYFEWNNPWSAVLQTKFITSYSLSEDDYGTFTTEDSEINTNVETLLRFGSRSFITVNLGGDLQKNYLGDIGYSIIPGAGLNLNIFTFLYVQFNYESTFPVDGSATHTLSAQITGQF